MKPPIFILGAPRSGMRLVTELLHKAGMHIGERRDQHLESLPVLFSNEKLMQQCSANWDNPISYRAALREQHFLPMQSEKLREMFLATKAQKDHLGIELFEQIKSVRFMEQPWAMKDARFSYTLPVWLSVFPNAKIIRLRRHGVDVAASMHRRQSALVGQFCRTYGLEEIPITTRFRTGFIEHSLRCTELDGAFSLWEEYEQQCSQLLQGTELPCMTIQFETLLQNPVRHVAELLAFCELSGPNISLDELQALADGHQAYKYRGDAELVAFAEAQAKRLAALDYQP